MPDRERVTRDLAVGDIFHARSPNGASLVCLVTALDGDAIYARRIHTQEDIRFDRKTGAEWGKERTKIDCIAPLPAEIHNILLKMDQRYQAAHELIRQGIEVDPREARHTADERRAHDVLDAHIAANLI